MGKSEVATKTASSEIDGQRAAARADAAMISVLSVQRTRASSTIPAAYMLFALFFSETRMVQEKCSCFQSRAVGIIIYDYGVKPGYTLSS